jgi:hypothetical protein
LAWESFNLTLGSVRAPGAGFFPAVLSVLLIALSARLYIRSRRRSGGLTAHFGPRINYVIVVAAAMGLYGPLLEPVGFLLLTPFLMLLILRGPSGLSWSRSVTVALVGTVSLYFLFQLLGVPLPGGLLVY